jgi:serine/threonine protein kinase
MNIESRRFRLVRRHAEGGIGRVSVAEDLALSREVAFKELKPNFASNPSARKRFVVEAEITGRLEHPGIVPVYSAGRLHDDRPFYAMKFVHGTSLADAIHEFHDSYHDTKETERNLQFRKLLRRFIDVCNAVEYAHSRGVIHRDIKPANVMLGEFGETLVVDWGLAKTVGRREEAEDESSATLHPGSGQDVTATQSGTVLGTPYYMSPEQAAGEIERVDWLSDVYSLGATLYELLTGKAPVVADQPTDQATRLALSEVLRRVREGEYPRPRSVASHVPAALEAICLRAMNSDKVRRYESAKVLAADLELWLADEPVSVWVEPLDQQAQRAQSQLARAQLNLVVALAQTADIAFRGGDRNKADVLYAQARDRV